VVEVFDVDSFDCHAVYVEEAYSISAAVSFNCVSCAVDYCVASVDYEAAVDVALKSVGDVVNG
jgi:hypothetical protein